MRERRARFKGNFRHVGWVFFSVETVFIGIWFAAILGPWLSPIATAAVLTGAIVSVLVVIAYSGDWFGQDTRAPRNATIVVGVFWLAASMFFRWGISLGRVPLQERMAGLERRLDDTRPFIRTIIHDDEHPEAQARDENHLYFVFHMKNTGKRYAYGLDLMCVYGNMRTPGVLHQVGMDTFPVLEPEGPPIGAVLKLRKEVVGFIGGQAVRAHPIVWIHCGTRYSDSSENGQVYLDPHWLLYMPDTAKTAYQPPEVREEMARAMQAKGDACGIQLLNSPERDRYRAAPPSRRAPSAAPARGSDPSDCVAGSCSLATWVRRFKRGYGSAGSD